MSIISRKNSDPLFKNSSSTSNDSAQNDKNTTFKRNTLNICDISLCPYCLDFQSDIINHIYMCDSFIYMEKHNFTNNIDIDFGKINFEELNATTSKLSYADMAKLNINTASNEEITYIPETLIPLMNTTLPYYGRPNDICFGDLNGDLQGPFFFLDASSVI